MRVGQITARPALCQLIIATALDIAVSTKGMRAAHGGIEIIFMRHEEGTRNGRKSRENSRVPVGSFEGTDRIGGQFVVTIGIATRVAIPWPLGHEKKGPQTMIIVASSTRQKT